MDNTLAEEPIMTIPIYWGYITLIIAIFFYGSFLVPVKKYNTGDGMFFQLILCTGIWCVAFVINWIRDFPKFYALPMLGGVMFTTGNICSVPIIKLIGLTLGMLIWGLFSLIFGWANARFGWFGIIPQIPKILWMNYVGVVLAAISGIFYVLVKPKVGTVDEQDPTTENQTNRDFNLRRLSPTVRFAFGIILSIFAGVLYGLSYAPYTYLVDNYENASTNGLDYVLSFYSGILMSSIVYYVIYSMFTKNNPYVNIKAILPSFLSGCMWGIANSCFLIANSSLSQAITFPIGASGPPLIASLYGIFLFREIEGKRNFIILIAGGLLTVTGAIFTGLSK